MKNLLVLVLFILVCQGAGILGVLTSDTGQSEWYRALEKPSFNPPSWVFGPVWTTLYAMMGVAAWLVWRQGFERPEVRLALALFALQLLLNAAWTPVFFGAHRLGAALVVIVLLWLAIIATISRFWPISKTAAWLLVPYLLWVSFATVLNASYWQLNR